MLSVAGGVDLARERGRPRDVGGAHRNADLAAVAEMTGPSPAGSDPTLLQSTAVLDGDQWVINGHKWFTSNGFRADFLIVMCRTEGSGADNGRMTQIIVPKDTPGLRIVRGVEIWGRPSDHCEITYDDVRVPLEKRIEGAEKLGKHKASTVQDVARGRPLEWYALMGAIIELGQMLSVPTPHIDAVYACVKLLNETMGAEHVGVKAYPLN